MKGNIRESYPLPLLFSALFFGHDILKVREKDAHAFVGNYQKVGHLEENVFTVLKPSQQQATYNFNSTTRSLAAVPENAPALEKMAGYYQTASDMYREGTYRQVSAVASIESLSETNLPE